MKHIVSDLTTTSALMAAARTLVLAPEPNRSVFYAEDEGKVLARLFVKTQPGYTRLDELVCKTKKGRHLWSMLTGSPGLPWTVVEPVWRELSYKFARESAGTVNCFVPKRFLMDRPLEESRHRYSKQSFVNTQFEMIEEIELRFSEKVKKILYNGIDSSTLFSGD
jgi:hypothetical protein